MLRFLYTAQERGFFENPASRIQETMIMKYMLIRRACTAACVFSLLTGTLPGLIVPDAGRVHAHQVGTSASDT
jgi:hypothetical protein